MILIIAAILAWTEFLRGNVRGWIGAVLFMVAVLLFIGRLTLQRNTLGSPAQSWILVALDVLTLFVFRSFIDWERSARVLPLITTVAFLGTGIAALRQMKSSSDRLDARLLTVNLGAWPRLCHYGGTLSLPSLLLAVALLCYWLPRRIANSKHEH